MRRFALTLALLLSPALFAGCKSSCRQLAEKLCECRPSTASKEACLRDVSARESRYSANDEQQATCQALFADCDCHDLESSDSAVRAEAKKKCGLARE